MQWRVMGRFGLDKVGEINVMCLSDSDNDDDNNNNGSTCGDPDTRE